MIVGLKVSAARVLAFLFAITLLSSVAKAAAVTWTGAGDGIYWQDVNNWSTHALPGANDDVTIPVISGNPTIYLPYLAGNVQIHSLTSSEPVNVSGGSLQVTTPILISSELLLTSDGTIVNSTIQTTGNGKLTLVFGGLYGCTLASDVTMDTGFIGIKNGLILNATLTLSSNATLSFRGTQTLGGVGKLALFDGELNAGGDGTGTVQGAATVTIGPQITIDGGGTSEFSIAYAHDTLINQGTVTVENYSRLKFTCGDPTCSLVNQGSMKATAGGFLTLTNLADAKGLSTDSGGTIELDGTWQNTGILTAVDSTLTLNGTWTNTGTISLSHSSMNVTGDNLTVAQMGAITNFNGGTVSLSGTLNNIGSTLSIGTAQGAWGLGCVVEGGTIAQSGSGSVDIYAPFLDGVTLSGSVSSTNAVKVIHGLTLNGTATISSGGDFYFVGTQTLGGTGQIILNGNSSNLQTQGDGTKAGAAVLTIGSNMKVTAIGYNELYLAYQYDSIVNNGTITADGLGQNFNIYGVAGGAPLVNNGTINLLNGVTFFTNIPMQLNGQGGINTSAASTVTFISDLTGSTTGTSNNNLSATVTINGGGTPGAPQLLEVMSKDLGNVDTGLSQPYAYGNLNISTTGTATAYYVKLVDQSHNSPGTAAEALYAQSITVAHNTTLDLNGLNVYARYFQNSGTILHGTIHQIANAGAISLSVPSPGQITNVGEADDWTFSGTAGQTISLLESPNSSIYGSLADATIQLLDANNNVVASADAASAYQSVSLSGFVLPSTGNYTIRVTAGSINPNAVGYYLLSAGVVTINSQSLALNHTAIGTISTPFAEDQWNFSGKAGEVVGFHVASQPNYTAYRLTGPNGYVAFNDQQADVNVITLPSDGTYTVTVYDSNGATGNYSFGVYQVVPNEFTLNLDQPCIGKISIPFTTDQWNFAGVAGQQIQFFANGNTAGVDFTLTAADGTVLFQDATGTSGLINLPSTGQYTLSVYVHPSLYDPYSTNGVYNFQIHQTTVVPLTIGQTYNGTFAGTGQSQIFTVPVPAVGNNFLVHLGGHIIGHTEIYARLGSAPTRDTFDASDTSSGGTHDLLVPNAAPGTWYILVYAEAIDATSGGFTLKADSSETVVSGISSTEAGTVSDFVLNLNGAGFNSSTVVSFLASNGTTSYPAATTTANSPTSLTAGFTVGSVPAGTYSIVVTQADGTKTTYPTPFTVVQGGVADFHAHLELNNPMGRHVASVIYVDYTNSGSAAMPAPILIVGATNPSGLQGALMTLNGDLQTDGFWTSATPIGFSQSIQILASGATPGVLNPGESVRIPIYYDGWLTTQWDFSRPSLNFSLTSVRAEDTTPVDWASKEASLQPPGMTAAAWHIMYASILAQLGTTQGGYVQFFDKQASYLRQIGQNVSDPNILWSFALQQAQNAWPVPSLGDTVDDSLPIPGSLSLEFSRKFNQTIPGRFRTGILGLGWTTPWEQSLSIGPDGTITVFENGRPQATYQPDSRASHSSQYFSAPGDHNHLVNEGPDYRLTTPSGLSTVFNTDGTFSYREDTNSNRITATYSSGKLASLTASSGQSLAFTYNVGGLLTSVTDSVGRKTTYSYDVASHLKSVQRFDGTTTTYVYNTTTGSPSVNALTTITEPTGTHEYFTYDGNGRLSTISADGGSQLQTITYNLGQIGITDALGHASSVYFDQNGQTAKAVDALGNVTLMAHDAAYNLTRVTNAVGATATYTYDDLGHPTSVTDYLGHTTSVIYGGFYNKASSLVDTQGNATQFTYTASGNLSAIYRPDGTQEQFTYDPLGNGLSYTNAAGQTIQCTYDSGGRITGSTLPDQAAYTYSYDAQGHVVAATNAAGTTALAYSSTTGYLTKVTYPNGKFLSFSYDTGGRRIQMVDQTGYTINYSYNASGQLSALKDTGGSTIVSYTYNAIGQLTQKTNANGTYTTYQYDATGNIQHLVNFAPGGTVNSRFDDTYNALGMKTTETTLGGKWTYSYDANSQLVHAVFASTNTTAIPNQDLAYTYDSLGNRTKAVVNGVTTNYTVNIANQYTKVGTKTYTYDVNGNLLKDGTNTNTYNSLNQLVSVANGSGTTTYVYDATGQRISSTTGSKTTTYQIDPAELGQVVSTYDKTGTLISHFTHGLGLACQTTGATKSFFDFDALGSTVGISNTTGAYANQYNYQPFGGILTSSESAPNIFQFAGQWGLQADAGGMTFMRARSYSPNLGRFLQADPMRYLSGETNLYLYCLNGPQNYFDPTGLFTAQLGIAGNINLGLINANFNIGVAVDHHGNIAGYTAVGGGAGLGAHAGIGLNGSISDAHTINDLAGGFVDSSVGVGGGLGGSVETYKGENSDHSLITGWGGGIGVGAGAEVSGTYTWTVLYPWNYDPDATDNEDDSSTSTVGATDPNGMYGPAGYGVANYVTNMGQYFAYRITYENSATASAPAQIVTITENLDPSLDWSTFQLTGIGFGDYNFIIPQGSQHYAKTISMTYLGQTFNVLMEAGIHSTTGQVYATFQSLDPQTQLPPSNVLIGFLPPEDGTGRGDGYLTYNVAPKAGIAPGTRIPSVANIVFDGNAAIATNQVDDSNPALGTDPTKEAAVSIDSGAPFAQMTALPASSPAAFNISWTGSDTNGPGVAGYTVYVSSDGGTTYSALLSNTLTTSTSFTGTLNTTYNFYVVATDALGLVQQVDPASASVKTTVRPNALTFAQWEAQFPGLTDLAADHTPMGDNIPTLLKYVYNIDPSRKMSAADRAALPVFALASNGDPTLTYRQFALQTGITLNVQTSSDLKTWTTAASSATLTAGKYTLKATGTTDANSGDPYMQVEFKPTGTPVRQYLRMNVTLP